MSAIKNCVAILVLTSTLIFTANGQREYRILLSKDDPTMDLRWNIDYKHNTVNFILEITDKPKPAPLATVVGIGISDRGLVTNADIAVIRYDDNSADVLDSWSDKTGKIIVDLRQDYHLTGYSVTTQNVTIAFTRKIDTMDTQDYALDNGTTNLFYLLQKEENGTTASPYDKAFPGICNRSQSISLPTLNACDMRSGTMSVQLLKPEIPSSYFGKTDNVSVFTIQQPRVTLPAQVTTYWCSSGKLPDSIQTKIHGIGFSANITIGNENFIHHMEVFLCNPQDGDVSAYSGLCGSKNVPAYLLRCNRVVGAWAKGALDMFYPKEAGIPLGVKEDSRYFRLEIHYHNPEKISNLIDSSGMNFYYTEKLRKYDVGVLEVGVTYNQNLAIPPRHKDFELKGVCAESCTMKGLSSGGIKVFASQLHTHLAGTSARISHYRRTTSLPDLNRDEHYQSMFQEVRHIYPPVDIIPGDSLVMSCSYNTMNRPNVTTTGDSLFEEMCISYLHYYPLSPLEVCKSTISTETLEEFFVLEKLFTGRPRYINFDDLPSNYEKMKWTPQLINELQITYNNAPQDVECKGHDGRGIQLGDNASTKTWL